jgi:Tol biopolymer transport system component
VRDQGIAFVRLDERDRGRIHLVPPDGGLVRALTDPELDMHRPAWSPDGSRLVALGRGPGDGIASQVYLVDPASGQAERITHNGVPKGSPSWSRDGSEIFVALSVGRGGYDLFGLRPDGSGLRQITGPPFEGELPPVLEAADVTLWVEELTEAGGVTAPPDAMQTWSPTENAVAFVRSILRRGPAPDDTAVERHIWTSGPDGGQERQLTEGPVEDGEPVYSPDGSRIAFSRCVEGEFIDDASGRHSAVRLWLMNADGTDPRVLTPDPADYASPSWSPDGTRLVCSRSVSGPPHLHVIGADGSNGYPLTQPGGYEDYDPAWRPS